MLENDFSPKGYVVISDKDGNIIREGHNMVLLDGKKIIASKLSNCFNGLLKNNETLNKDKTDFSHYEIAKLILSTDANETTFNGTYSTVGDVTEFQLSSENTSINNVENSNGHFSFKISVQYKGESSTDNKIASSICLVATKEEEKKEESTDESEDKEVTDKTTNNEKIFSRIRFDSVVLDTESDFNISYYLYF